MPERNNMTSDNKMIREILEACHICRLALHDDPAPYIVPVNYGYDGKSLFFHGAKTGKKLDLIAQNNCAGFEIEMPCEIVSGSVACEWTTRFRSLVGTGRIVSVSGFQAKKAALDVIMRQHGDSAPAYRDESVRNVHILRLDIETVTAKQSRGEY